jgi:hypoxanthine phosphoribosyltransferase
MKGSFIFTSDFVREIKTPFSIQAVTCSSYGQRGKKRGELTIKGLEDLDLRSKHVLIIDDICDSGKTFEAIKKEVEKQKPSSVKGLVMLLKKNPKRIKEASLPDYYLFEIEDKFVVGYGLDYKEYFRGLKGIYSTE